MVHHYALSVMNLSTTCFKILYIISIIVNNYIVSDKYESVWIPIPRKIKAQEPGNGKIRLKNRDKKRHEMGGYFSSTKLAEKSVVKRVRGRGGRGKDRMQLRGIRQPAGRQRLQEGKDKGHTRVQGQQKLRQAQHNHEGHGHRHGGGEGDGHQ